MESNIDDEIIQNHDQADALISLFFAAVDTIAYITILTLFGWEFKNLFSQKQRLSLLIMLDAILRIVNLSTSFVYSFPKEVCITVFATIQFFIIINLLNEIFTDRKNPNYSNESGINNRILFTCIFYIFAMVFNFSKFISFIQYVSAIICATTFRHIITDKCELFLKGVEKKNPNFKGQNFIFNLPYFIEIYFIIHYILKILGLFVVNQLYSSYMEMACDVFKEVGKYLSFVLVISIFYLYNKYIKEEEIGLENEVNNQTSGNTGFPEENEELKE